jgi:hypothetical protein
MDAVETIVKLVQKVRHAFDMGTSPAVDGLIRISYYEQACRRKKLNKVQLRFRGILELIYQHVLPPPPQMITNVNADSQKLPRGENQIIEIQSVA